MENAHQSTRTGFFFSKSQTHVTRLSHRMCPGSPRTTFHSTARLRDYMYKHPNLFAELVPATSKGFQIPNFSPHPP